MGAYEEKEEEKEEREKEEGGKTWGIERRWTEWNEKRGTGKRTTAIKHKSIFFLQMTLTFLTKTFHWNDINHVNRE